MTNPYKEALKASSMRACRTCLERRLVFTDHDVEDMVKTAQGYMCRDHYEEAKNKRKAAKFACLMKVNR